VNKFNMQRIADKGWFSSLPIEWGANNSSPRKNMLLNVKQGIELERILRNDVKKRKMDLIFGRIFAFKRRGVTGVWIKLRNEELHCLYS
jgi:hypothetical protein